jgi:putative SOS response-associated peptidase YedK
MRKGGAGSVLLPAWPKRFGSLPWWSPQADDIRINDLAPVMRAAGNGIELAQMRFGFPPSNPRGGRQVAVLQPKDWHAWIELTVPEAELLKPLPAA